MKNGLLLIYSKVRIKLNLAMQVEQLNIIFKMREI